LSVETVNNALLIIVSCVSLEAMFVWRWKIDSCLGNFVEQQICEIKVCSIFACMTWTLVLENVVEQML